jgi:acyl-CoA synthetase (AMP-forming)/AMP-acid ligase II
VLTEASLRSDCRDLLEAIKIPRSFTLVEQFPRTATGKADRRTLAARPEGAGSASGGLGAGSGGGA